MSKCNCIQCDCTVEGLHEYPDWLCSFCKAGNHIENEIRVDSIKK